MNRLFTTLVATLLAATTQAHTYTIVTTQPRQTIEHFGASDAWSMQYIGLWPEEEQQRQVAQWLFSTDNDANGQPLGIGLSLWRFNLGAGSAYQGDSAAINRATRTECFLMPDGTYDWQRQQGQLRFLSMARDMGVARLLAFLNSPPVYFTRNHLATNTGRDGTLNLRDDAYDDFARFMADAVEGLEREHGLHIDYLSPVNEPDGHWNWQGPKQEGSPATNAQIARVARLTGAEMQRRGLTTQLLLSESSDLRCVLGTYKTSWRRANVLDALFCPDSTGTYVGNVPQVLPVIAAHSYWTNTPPDSMKYIRMQLRDAAQRRGVSFWQTELCIMQNDEEIGGGNGYDFTMTTALYVARVIHHDLTRADAASWSWWRACGGNYKDGLIRVYDRSHEVRDSRLLWALGNYSRFIRPGAVRYDIVRQDAGAPSSTTSTGTPSSTPSTGIPSSTTDDEGPYGVMASAYRGSDGRWVCVVINYSATPQPFTLALSDGTHHLWQQYRTSDVEGETLKPIGTPLATPVVLPPRSITTFVAQ